MDTPNTIWFTAYTSGGFRVSFTLIADPADLPTADFIDSTMARLGYHPQPVELADNTTIEDVDAVVRAVTSKGDPVVYCYRQTLEWKVGQIYLNTAAEVAAFEAVSGLKLDSLPLYEGQGAPQRRDRAPVKWERACRVFQISKTLVGQDDQGKPRYKYALHSRVQQPAAGNAPAPSPQGHTGDYLQMPASILRTAETMHSMHARKALADALQEAGIAARNEQDIVLKSLGISNWSDYSGTVAQLLAIINPSEADLPF